MYKLLISSKAEAEIKELSKKYERAVLEALADIKEDPFLGKPLTKGLTGRFSYRIGVHRIVYRVRAKDKVVEILTTGHRSVIYN